MVSRREDAGKARSSNPATRNGRKRYKGGVNRPLRGREMEDEPRRGERDEAVVAALGLVNRVIQLDQAADSMLWHARSGAGSSGLAAEGLRLGAAYRDLGAALAALDLPGPTAAAIAAVIDHHLRLVRAAVDLVYRPQSEPVATQRLRLFGVGPTAQRLVELRDRLAAEASSDALNPLTG
jgi:hypothetical protein